MILAKIRTKNCVYVIYWREAFRKSADTGQCIGCVNLQLNDQTLHDKLFDLAGHTVVSVFATHYKHSQKTSMFIVFLLMCGQVLLTSLPTDLSTKQQVTPQFKLNVFQTVVLKRQSWEHCSCLSMIWKLFKSIFCL